MVGSSGVIHSEATIRQLLTRSHPPGVILYEATRTIILQRLFLFRMPNAPVKCQPLYHESWNPEMVRIPQHLLEKHFRASIVLLPIMGKQTSESRNVCVRPSYRPGAEGVFPTDIN